MENSQTMDRDDIEDILVLFFIGMTVVSICVAHLVLIHINQREINKLQIKGKTAYSIMTFIVVYYLWVSLASSLFIEYQNRSILTMVIAFGGLLYFGYFVHSIWFIKNNLKSGVSKEQDKQRNLCITGLAITTLLYVVFLIFGKDMLTIGDSEMSEFEAASKGYEETGLFSKIKRFVANKKSEIEKGNKKEKKE